jgi:hypothetical protein
MVVFLQRFINVVPFDAPAGLLVVDCNINNDLLYVLTFNINAGLQ